MWLEHRANGRREGRFEVDGEGPCVFLWRGVDLIQRQQAIGYIGGFLSRR